MKPSPSISSLFLTHLVIIPDGNRRWARLHNLTPWRGHRKGIERFEEIANELLLKYEIPYTTFWAASRDNLVKRSTQEVRFLYRLFATNFRRLAKDKQIHKNKIRVRVLGFWPEIVPKFLVNAIEEVTRVTSPYKKRSLTFLLGYDGIEEMVRAIKKIIQEGISQDEIKYETVKQHLLTSSLPPVDYIIRTGTDNDPHNSAGFMMWHTVYSQFYFTQTFWPDFTKEELRKALEEFKRRERRLGG